MESPASTRAIRRVGSRDQCGIVEQADGFRASSLAFTRRSRLPDSAGRASSAADTDARPHYSEAVNDREKLRAEALLGAVEDGDVVWSGSPRSMRPPKPATSASEPTPTPPGPAEQS